MSASGQWDASHPGGGHLATLPRSAWPHLEEHLSAALRHSVMQYDQIDLLTHYGMDASWAECAATAARELPSPPVALAGALRCPVAVDSLQIFLGLVSSGRLYRMRALPCGPVYPIRGMRDISVDVSGNVFVESQVAHQHIVSDLLRLEADVLLRCSDADHRVDRWQMSEWLGLPPSPSQGIATSLDVPSGEQGDEPRGFIEWLQHCLRRRLGEDREIVQLLVPRLRFAMDVLMGASTPLLQQHLAMARATACAEQLLSLLKQIGDFRIHWLPQLSKHSGDIGLAIVPGRVDHLRSLDVDLVRLANEGVSAVLCLLAHREFERYGVPELLSRYATAGFEVLHRPIIDQHAPDFECLREAVAWIKAQVCAGRKVLIHCAAGLGRAGTVAACWLCYLGLPADQAIAMVRAVHDPRAVETSAQEQAVHAFWLAGLSDPAHD